MKKTFYLLFSVLLLSSVVYSQESLSFKKPRYNALYTELGGSSGLASVNYDYCFQLTNSLYLAAGAGTGYMYVISDENSHGTLFLTPSVNLLIGESSHFIELGSSIQIAFDGIILPTSRIGYRYQSQKNPSVFRIAFTPIIRESGILPWAGVSFGVSF